MSANQTDQIDHQLWVSIRKIALMEEQVPYQK
jgi:hypothetical protein